MKTYLVEYEIPPLRAIYQGEIDALTKRGAVSGFMKAQPHGRIRKINGVQYVGKGSVVEAYGSTPQTQTEGVTPMDIKRTNDKTITGEYSASVKVDKTTIDLKGRFKIADPGSVGLTKSAIELAIRSDIQVYVTGFDLDPQATEQS
jgi:hypothetical protein